MGRAGEGREGRGGARACPATDNFWLRHCRYAEFYVGKIPHIRIGGVPLERAVVLKWFYSLSRWKTFVGGKCALPSSSE